MHSFAGRLREDLEMFDLSKPKHRQRSIALQKAEAARETAVRYLGRYGPGPGFFRRVEAMQRRELQVDALTPSSR